MKVVEFKDFVDYDKRLGKIIITGLEGSGKTMLLTALAIGKMLHGIEDCFKSYDAVDEYNELGFNFSKNYEHLAFGNLPINCSGTFIPDREIYECSPYRLGLFDPLFETDIYPPYSCFFFTETYNFLNSYLYNKFRDSFRGFLKTCRQQRFDMVVDTHSVSDICTIFKRLTGRFIHLYKEVEHIKNKDGVIVGHRFFVREWSDYRQVEAYERSPNSVVNYDEYELILNQCLFENYDTEFCRYLALEGRAFQDYIVKYFDKVENVDDLDDFGVKFGIIPPPGFFVGKSNKFSPKNNNSEIDDDLDDDSGLSFEF